MIEELRERAIDCSQAWYGFYLYHRGQAKRQPNGPRPAYCRARAVVIFDRIINGSLPLFDEPDLMTGKGHAMWPR